MPRRAASRSRSSSVRPARSPRGGGRTARHHAGRHREDARREAQRRHASCSRWSPATGRSRGRSCGRWSASTSCSCRMPRRARGDRLRARHDHPARLDHRLAGLRRRARRRPARVDGRGRARHQPVRGRRRPHRGVRRDGRRHQRASSSACSHARRGCSRRRPRSTWPRRSPSSIANGVAPGASVAAVTVRSLTRRFSAAPGVRPARRPRLLRTRDAVLAVDDEERDPLDAVLDRLRLVGLHGGEVPPLAARARHRAVEAELGCEVGKIFDRGRRGGPPRSTPSAGAPSSRAACPAPSRSASARAP